MPPTTAREEVEGYLQSCIDNERCKADRARKQEQRSRKLALDAELKQRQTEALLHEIQGHK